MNIIITIQQLRDLWSAEISKDTTVHHKDKEQTKRIDVLSWLSKMTLDVIGQAGQYLIPAAL